MKFILPTPSVPGIRAFTLGLSSEFRVGRVQAQAESDIATYSYLKKLRISKRHLIWPASSRVTRMILLYYMTLGKCCLLSISCARVWVKLPPLAELMPVSRLPRRPYATPYETVHIAIASPVLTTGSQYGISILHWLHLFWSGSEVSLDKNKNQEGRHLLTNIKTKNEDIPRKK